MMHGVEGGHEVVLAGLELETFSGRLSRLELVDSVGPEHPVDLFQHCRVGIDAGEKEMRYRLEHQQDIAPGAAADVRAPRLGQTFELPCDSFHRFPVGRANGPVDRRDLGEMPGHVGPGDHDKPPGSASFSDGPMWMLRLSSRAFRYDRTLTLPYCAVR